jgi:hypothetical protein
MDALFEFWRNQWHAYPEWLVVTSLTIAGLTLLWLVAKFMAWLLKWLLITAAFAVIVGVVVYLAG